MQWNDAEHSMRLLEEGFPENDIHLLSMAEGEERDYGVRMDAPDGIAFDQFPKLTEAAAGAKHSHLLPRDGGGLLLHIS